MIVLAAGLSRRYGTEKDDKLLADLDGKPMYRHITDRLLALREMRDDIDDLTIITRRGPVCEACQQDKRLLCLENPHPERGIASSLQVALTAAGDPAGGEDHALVCFVADAPYLRTDTVEALLDGFSASGKPMAAVRYRHATYNPCIFRNDCWEDLRKLSGDTGGKQLIRRNPEAVYYYDLPEERSTEINDIDYKAE